MYTTTLHKIRIISALSEHNFFFLNIKGQFLENKNTLRWILANPAE